MRRVVVLPAPLRPTSPMRSPGCTRRSGPSGESRMRAPARTSRSVAAITFALLGSGSVQGRTGLLVVGEDRRPLLSARRNRFFEVGGEQTHEKLPQALGLHVPLQAGGLK